MNCKNFKIKQKNYKRIFYCNVQRKEIDYHKCSKECEYYEDKMHNDCAKASLKNKECTKKSKYCTKSKEVAKLERNRTSILTDDLNHCIICGTKKDHLHEVFPGIFRQRSMKEKMVIPLCTFHHTQIHNDIMISLYWKQRCQKEFEKSHTREEFIQAFGRNYL